MTPAPADPAPPNWNERWVPFVWFFLMFFGVIPLVVNGYYLHFAMMEIGSLAPSTDLLFSMLYFWKENDFLRMPFMFSVAWVYFSYLARNKRRLRITVWCLWALLLFTVLILVYALSRPSPLLIRK